NVAPAQIISPPVIPGTITLPETSARSTSDMSIYPMLSSSGDVAGWIYLNLNNGNMNVTYSVARPGFFPPGTTRPSQNWVITSMFAEGRFSVDFDATMLGNGCSPAIASGTAI